MKPKEFCDHSFNVLLRIGHTDLLRCHQCGMVLLVVVGKTMCHVIGWSTLIPFLLGRLEIDLDA